MTKMSRRIAEMNKSQRAPAPGHGQYFSGVFSDYPLDTPWLQIVGTVAYELRRNGGRYALATQCVGAGMGISTVLECPD